MAGSDNKASVALDAVLSGSYRKAPERLRLEHEQLVAVGCRILSPSNVDHTREREGFVFMRGETSTPREKIEDAHLLAIRRAKFVWLHAPSGYVGVSAAMEIGYAFAVGVPVFAREAPSDAALAPFVRIVTGPDAVVAHFEREWRALLAEPRRCGDCGDLVGRCECN